MIRFLARVLLAVALALVGWLLAGWLLAGLATLVAVPLFVRTQDGRIWWAAILARARFAIDAARGRTTFTGSGGLPEPLTGLTLAQDEPYAILADDRGHFSVVVPFSPERSQWLDSIDDEPGLASASITSQTGVALRSGFTIAQSTPALARSVLREALPPTATLPAAWACLTWRDDHQASERRAVIDDFVARTGLDQPLSAATVTALVSTAFSPARDPVTDWGLVGPDHAREFRNRYEHGDAVSVMWHVTAGAAHLGQLLTNDTSASLERATALYTPQPAGGGLRQSLVVTLTCPDDLSLARAAAAVRARAQACGVTLAPCAAAMASSFAWGLGIAGGLR